MLKAENERVKTFSRSKITGMSHGKKRDRNGERDTSLTKYDKSQQQEGAADQLWNFVRRWIHHGC